MDEEARSMSVPREQTSVLGTPTRWRHQLDGRGMMGSTLWTLARIRVSPDDPRIALLRDGLVQGDPPADAAVEWMQSAPDSRAMFERALEHGTESVRGMPAVLRELFADADSPPSWLDRDRVRLGAETMLRVGPGGYAALGNVSLMGGYLAGAAVKPLAMTGALTRMARRRLIETSKFVLDVSRSRDFGRFSPGMKSAIRVRLMHAMVRRGLAASPRWRTEDWGTPINQHDMAATNLQFSVMFIAGLVAQGYLLSRAEREAVMHLWRYVGLISGVRTELLSPTFREGLELGWIINQTEEGPDADSRALAQALMQATREAHSDALGPTLGALRARRDMGLSRFFLGDRNADALGIPDDGFKYLPLVAAPITACLELARIALPGGRALSVMLGEAITKTAIERSLHGRAPTFVPEPSAG